MDTDEDIPDIAICHRCGNPMKVIYLEPLAIELGMKVRRGAFVIECCDSQLTIEDEAASMTVRDLLAKYHSAQSNTRNT